MSRPLTQAEYDRLTAINDQDVISSLAIFAKLPLEKGKIAAGKVAKAVVGEYIAGSIEYARQAPARHDKAAKEMADLMQSLTLNDSST